jgi:hypothetical protein
MGESKTHDSTVLIKFFGGVVASINMMESSLYQCLLQKVFTSKYVLPTIFKQPPAFQQAKHTVEPEQISCKL